MMKYLSILLSLLFFSGCNVERVVELPKLSQVEITQVKDHSSIYVFYDESKGQAILNRNGLITSTQWIFHIDRRNSFGQVVDIINELQLKKSNPMNPHNNPDSHNYFSVADITKKQLGFIDFTSTRFSSYESLKENLEVFVVDGRFFISKEEVNIDQLKDINHNRVWIFEGKISFQKFMEIYHMLVQKEIHINKVQYIN